MGKQKRYLEITWENKVRLGFYKDEAGETDVEIIEWHKQVGDIIGSKKDPNTGSVIGELIVELSSSKGLVEVEAVGEEIGARIVEILIPEGESVTVDLHKESLRLAVLEVEGDASSIQEDFSDSESEPEGRPENEDVEQERERVPVSPAARKAARERGINLDEVLERLPSSVERVEVEHLDELTFRDTSGHEAPQENEEILASPATRVLARESGVDLAGVEGSGPGGIILPADFDPAGQDEGSEEVITIDRPDTSGSEEIEFSEWEIETYGLEAVSPTRQRLAVARNLRRPIEEMVLVGAGRDVNMSSLTGLRSRTQEYFEQQYGIKLRYDHFFLTAVTQALKEPQFERLNARWQWDGERKTARIILYRHINLALAVAAEDGLVTPVVMRCEEKTFVEIALEAERLIAKALEGKLLASEVGGMTFTVNNTGPFGDEYPDPVPNPDTAAILAFGAIRGGVKAIPQLAMMRLKFDHQLLDGQEIGPFMGRVKELLESPEQLFTIK